MKMILTMLKSKIHRAVVTEANLDYVGSITIDSDILDQAGILEYEQVHVVNINNGNRFETYAIAGPRGSGIICLNGAAARLAHAGDKVIIMAYCSIDSQNAGEHKPVVVFVNENNQVVEANS
jgi:aspartate 1-decarboxylase